MSILKWIFGKKEYISPQAVKHSSLGDYTTTNRMTGGGHGQESVDYMKRNHIDHNILVEYDNGVRAGNVPEHKKRIKKTGIGQSWFPKSWDRKKIRRTGRESGECLPSAAGGYGNDLCC